MKDGVCPKCGSKEVLKGLPVMDQGNGSSGRLMLVIEENSGRSDF